MTEKILFAEKQKYNKWWIIIMIFGLVGLAIFAIVQQVVYEKPFGNNPMSNNGLYALFVFSILFTFLFWKFSLETRITESGVYVRFFPFHLKFQYYNWQTIRKAYLRKYDPISEYGGWGYRMGIFGKGRALNIAGDQGLQLEFTNGKKLLIGTEKSHEMQDVLQKMNLQNEHA